MNKFAQAMQTASNLTTTENGAVTYKSTLSNVLDLFASGGAFRTRDEKAIATAVQKAYSEDPLLALKVLFYLRDIRGGQGERRTFRIGLTSLVKNYPDSIKKNLQLVPEFGRWDDLFSFVGTALELDALSIIAAQFRQDLDSNKPSLLAKWMPSENTSSEKTKALGKKMRSFLNMTPRNYRKALTALRSKLNVVEQEMCANEWGNITYSHVPSRASMIYRKAFKKHDEARYTEFLAKVEKGEAKINASALFPYDVIKPAFSYGEDYKTLDLQWAALPDYFEGKQSNGLVMADVSGSMNGLPICISISLAMYIGERNKGPFHNMFMTFSEHPSIQQIKGKTVLEKVDNLHKAKWDMNTNLAAAFDAILSLAASSGATQEELPDTLYIISDMEFDTATRGTLTNFEDAKRKFEAAGYTLPTVVFWNVNARNGQQPVKFNDKGVCLCSGSSPSILKSILSKKICTPVDLMLETINSERYSKISV